MPNTFADNAAMLNAFISRNHDRVLMVDASAFWLNDVGELDTEKQIQISLVSQKNWLKGMQPFGKTTLVYPIDGNSGVFQDPPPVLYPNDFVQKNGKRVGACDVLLLSSIFRFIELKLNASGESILQMAENREKATLQLARTVTFFIEKTPKNTFTAQNTVCIIAVPASYHYPRIAKTNNIAALRRSFIKKYKIDLQEITPNDVIES